MVTELWPCGAFTSDTSTEGDEGDNASQLLLVRYDINQNHPVENATPSSATTTWFFILVPRHTAGAVLREALRSYRFEEMEVWGAWDRGGTSPTARNRKESSVVSVHVARQVALLPAEYNLAPKRLGAITAKKISFSSY